MTAQRKQKLKLVLNKYGTIAAVKKHVSTHLHVCSFCYLWNQGNFEKYLMQIKYWISFSEVFLFSALSRYNIAHDIATSKVNKHFLNTWQLVRFFLSTHKLISSWNYDEEFYEFNRCRAQINIQTVYKNETRNFARGYCQYFNLKSKQWHCAHLLKV